MLVPQNILLKNVISKCDPRTLQGGGKTVNSLLFFRINSQFQHFTSKLRLSDASLVQGVASEHLLNLRGILSNSAKLENPSTEWTCQRKHFP